MLKKLLLFAYLVVIFITLVLLSLVSARLVKSNMSQINHIFVGFYIINSIIMNVVWRFKIYQIIIFSIVILALSHFLGRKLRVIGLTGQICSGKSTAARFITEKHKAYIIDIDKINAEVLKNKNVLNKIRNLFGDVVFDENNNLIKQKVREIVYKDPQKLKQLERITFFRIVAKMFYYIIKAKLFHENKIIVLENALLLRFDFLRYLCYPIISICTKNSAEIVRRVMNRDNSSKEVAEGILNKQLKLEKFIELSDYVIFNDNSERELLKEIDIIFSKLK